MVWLYFTDDCYEWMSGVEMPIGATQKGRWLGGLAKLKFYFAPGARLETG